MTIFKHIYKIKYLQYVRNCRKYWVQQYRYIRTHTNYKTYLCYKIRENSWIYKNNPSLNLFEPHLALPLDVRQSDSIRIFKGKLTVNSNLVCDKSRPDFYVLGERYTNIVHTKLRHNCAPNSDLFRCKIIDSPFCSCGRLEDTYHYFFICTKYTTARNDLFHEIFRIENL